MERKEGNRPISKPARVMGVKQPSFRMTAGKLGPSGEGQVSVIAGRKKVFREMGKIQEILPRMDCDFQRAQRK